jgi:hypothetical protein
MAAESAVASPSAPQWDGRFSSEIRYIFVTDVYCPTYACTTPGLRVYLNTQSQTTHATCHSTPSHSSRLLCKTKIRSLCHVAPPSRCSEAYIGSTLLVATTTATKTIHAPVRARVRAAAAQPPHILPHSPQGRHPLSHPCSCSCGRGYGHAAGRGRGRGRGQGRGRGRGRGRGGDR